MKFSDDVWKIPRSKDKNCNAMYSVIFDADEWGIIEKLFIYQKNPAEYPDF